MDALEATEQTEPMPGQSVEDFLMATGFKRYVPPEPEKSALDPFTHKLCDTIATLRSENESLRVENASLKEEISLISHV